MILQKDKRFKDPWFKNEACALFSSLFIVNKLTNYSFDPKTITKIVKDFKRKGILDKDMNLYWVEAFDYFGIKVRYHKEDASYKLEKGEYEITQYHNKKTGFKHFVVTQGDVVVFDPLGLSVTVREGYQFSKRVFEIL